ncbi:uncharacterized protein LOC141642764 isoform X2 [Silene latifolia]|uniref:uncharacterized protein LOC141642764 isoform X2 n=1 Tax=Silene latifolia TaxID=37657 RepID=UPI003D76C0A5
MIGNSNLISCNFRPFGPSYLYSKTHQTYTLLSSTHTPKFSNLSINHPNRHTIFAPYLYNVKNYNKGNLLFCSKRSVSEENPEVENNGNAEVESAGDDWTTSILLFLFWAALIYYVFNLAPNQTPSTDIYFLKKLSNLVGDDGFRMNQVLVSLWYIMGLWPIVYTMLLLPSARSSKSSIPVWPFVSLSFFGGAYALIPYFILWRPPPPPVKEDEVRSWPLNFLESKITAGTGYVARTDRGARRSVGFGYFIYKRSCLWFKVKCPSVSSVRHGYGR